MQKPHGLPEEAIAKLCGVFRQYPATQSMLLYGSRAKDNYRPGSGIDLSNMPTQGQRPGSDQPAKIMSNNLPVFMKKARAAIEEIANNTASLIDATQPAKSTST